MSPYPDWLRILSRACLRVSFVCAAIIIGDHLLRPQKMMIMNFVWPIYGALLGASGAGNCLTCFSIPRSDRSGRDGAEAYPGFGRRSELFGTLWCRLCEIVIFSGATHHKLEVCIPVVRLNQCCHNMCGASSGTDPLSPHGMTRGV